MQTGLYVSVSAQMTLNKRLETIANNVANASTAGYRAERITFASVLSEAAADPVAFAGTGRSFLDRSMGELVHTNNALDVALESNGWLAVQTPAGPVMTRDGRLRMSETGELQSLNGYPVLDSGNATILLDPSAGAPQIAHDGTIMQNGRQMATLGVFTIDDGARLTRYEGSGVIPDIPAQPAIGQPKAGMQQGYVERANINPVAEITRLIAVQRAFDAITASLSENETTLQDAIRTLGS